MGELAKGTTQLTPVESLRACVLIEEALKRLVFLGKLIREQKTEKRSHLTAAMGDDVIRLIGEQQDLEKMHQLLVKDKEELHGLQDRETLRATERQLQEASAKLKEANRDLCRNLRQTPDIHANMLKLNHERQRAEDWLTETLHELKASNTFKCLTDNVAQEKHAQERLAEARRRNREMSQAVRLLECELRKEEAEFAESRRATSIEVAALKQELQRLKSKAGVKLAFTEAAMVAQLEGKQWQLVQEEKRLGKELEMLQKEADEEAFLQRANADFRNKLIRQANFSHTSR
ncbi:hypothetical protein cyc_02345 [Cyclospora cayetanensis]|uniref:Uncharacterized protein n=1 Tax=Cyclospora cayetanensis TaxID=88456 RepID=A0A1D3DAR3_9EIME|nr:hypothetical protein cyc_02345 [Cyclospora cayetanensis]